MGQNPAHPHRTLGCISPDEKGDGTDVCGTLHKSFSKSSWRSALKSYGSLLQTGGVFCTQIQPGVPSKGRDVVTKQSQGKIQA